MLTDLSKLKDQIGENIKAEALDHVHKVLEDGVGLAGYAYVVWYMDGTTSASHWAARGPIGRDMVPALVHDVLLKRISELGTIQQLEDNK